jgi:hypothetical protein
MCKSGFQLSLFNEGNSNSVNVVSGLFNNRGRRFIQWGTGMPKDGSHKQPG